jgi:hypothetical protein
MLYVLPPSFGVVAFVALLVPLWFFMGITGLSYDFERAPAVT